jgi:hypothetical protein
VDVLPAAREPVPALVTLHLWRVEPPRVPAALLRMGRDRARVRRTPGLRFAKLLGTGDGRTFTVRDADPLRWGLLATWTSPAAARGLRGALAGGPRLAPAGGGDLARRPAAGRLARHLERAAALRRPGPRPVDGPVAALTRARLRPSAALGFWRAVPPVSADLRDRPGLRAAVGIGEAPIGLQGTFSLWESGAAVRRFAAGAAHAEVVARTGPRALVRRGAVRALRRGRHRRHARRTGPAGMTTHLSAELVELDRAAFAGLQDQVLDVYAEAMQVRPDAARSRRSILAAHVERDGLRAVAAVRPDEPQRLVGIAYGYRGAPGQWWHDQVRARSTRTPPGVARRARSRCASSTSGPAHQGTGPRARAARRAARRARTRRRPCSRRPTSTPAPGASTPPRLGRPGARPALPRRSAVLRRARACH